MNKFFLPLIALLLLFTACTKTRLNLPNEENVVAGSIREYKSGIPVSREIALEKGGSLEDLLSWCKCTYFVQERKKSVSEIPSVEKSYQIRFKDITETVRTLYIYAKGDKEYIEEPNLGIYSGKPPRRLRGFYKNLSENTGDISKSSYLYITLVDAFGGDNSILPEYNGAGKAIWMEFLSGGDKSTAHDNPLWWPSRFIPENRIAERAEDVRYIVAFFDTATPDGYWYVPSTGQRTGTSYKHNSQQKIYDILTGEITTLDYKLAELSEGLEKYFSNGN